MNAKHLIVLIALFLWGDRAIGQSVESYAGHERTGLDLMWFRNFRNSSDSISPILFFSRNRANVDYHDSPGAFGSTNALSYNFKNGIGIVGVGSFLNTGFTPKAGVQYYSQKNAWLFFGWLVTDLEKNGTVDLFGLLRYQPKFNKSWSGFNQLEVFPVLQPTSGNWNITQRIRLGVRYYRFATGFMLDLNQQGKEQWITTTNTGGFLRYEF